MVRPWLTVERWRRDRRVPPRAAGSRERPPIACDAKMQGMVGDVTLFCMLTIMLLGWWRRAIVITLRISRLSRAIMLIIMVSGMWRRLLGMHGPLGSTQGTEAV